MTKKGEMSDSVKELMCWEWCFRDQQKDVTAAIYPQKPRVDFFVGFRGRGNCQILSR